MTDGAMVPVGQWQPEGDRAPQPTAPTPEQTEVALRLARRAVELVEEGGLIDRITASADPNIGRGRDLPITVGVSEINGQLTVFITIGQHQQWSMSATMLKTLAQRDFEE